MTAPMPDALTARIEAAVRAVPRLPCGLCVQCTRTQPRFCTQRGPDYPAIAQAVAGVVGGLSTENTVLRAERDALRAALKLLEATLASIAGFASGHGDVCEVIARRARAALARLPWREKESMTATEFFDPQTDKP